LLAIDSPSGLQRAMAQTNRVSLQVTAPADELRAELLSVKGVTAVRMLSSDRDGRRTVECQVDSDHGIEATIARAVAARWDLHRLERQAPTLENIFLQYVADRSDASEPAWGAPSPCTRRSWRSTSARRSRTTWSPCSCSAPGTSSSTTSS